MHKEMLSCSEFFYQPTDESLPTLKKEKFISTVNVMFYYPVKQCFMYGNCYGDAY